MSDDRIAINPAPRHEKTVTRLTAIFIIAASVVFMVVACLVSVKIILHRYAQARPMQSMQPLGLLIAPDNRPLTHFPAPNLELDDGHADSTALHERQLEKLNSYGWVDRSNQIARIPIARAMDLIVLRGLPTTTPQTAANSLRLPPNRKSALP